MAMNLPKHMPALDGLRGVAILMVLMTHVADGWRGAWSIYPGDYSSAPSLALPQWLDTIAGAAEHGVTLFFVVSAFTLTSRAVQNNDDLRSYALRRLARVGPGYWIAGLGYTLVAGLAPRLWAPDGISPTDLIGAAVFAGAWGGGASLAVVPGGWSVACEVAFYIALPALIRLLNGRIWLSVTLTVLTLIIAQVRAIHAMDAGGYTLRDYVNPIQQAPVFLCGVTAAIVAIRLQLPRPLRFVSTLLIFYTIVGLPLLPIPQGYLLPHLHFAAVVAVAVAFAAAFPPFLLASRVMRRVGEVSYSMYLVHFAFLAPSLRVSEWLTSAFDLRTMLLHFIFTVIATFAIAAVTRRYVEQPAIRWAARRSVSRSVKAQARVQA